MVLTQSQKKAARTQLYQSVKLRTLLSQKIQKLMNMIDPKRTKVINEILTPGQKAVLTKLNSNGHK